VAEPAVVNASPLIYLGRANLLELLQLAGSAVVVPVTVANEVKRGARAGEVEAALGGKPWLEIVETPPAPPMILAWDLDPGETAVLAWAHVHHGATAILDDLVARRCAAALGIPVRGTLGLVVAAKQRGIIPAAQPVIEQLRHEGMYLSDDLIRQVLAVAGE
jgi:predicted nucleic acid-binding protein